MTTLIQPVEGVEPSPPQDGQYAYQTGVLVTPEYADQLIENNVENNRNLKESAISRYARDMSKGYWKDKTGEAIKIDPDGKFIDGQNRMHAVRRANRPIVFDIAWNVPTDRMLVIDGGTGRTVKDDFKITGTADRFVGGPLVRWILGFEQGNYMNHGGRLTPTRSEINDRYSKEPQAIDTAAMYGRYCHHAISNLNATTAALAYWLFAKIDQDATEKFFDAMITGANLDPTMPVSALRNKIIAARPKEFDRYEQLTLFIRVWNMTRRGDSAPPSGRLTRPDRASMTNETFIKPV